MYGRGFGLATPAWVVAVALLATPVVAQTAAQGSGVITGQVSAADGSALPGAEIIVRETGQRTSTDRLGRFRLSGVPTGQVTVDIDYLGYANGSREVQVTAGAPVAVSITLDSLEEAGMIVVTGGLMDQTARALNQQRTADNTTNVLSADAIGRFPDINIAEALQRVPGIGVERDQGEGNFISIRGAPSEFSAVSIDGVIVPSSSPDTRALDLGTFLSDVVKQVEVNKTLLPSQDADSIAGSVNLVTRSPFDNPRLRITGSGGGSYNELGGTSDWRTQGVVSNVFGKLGVLLSGSISQTDRRLDNVETVWDVVQLAGQDRVVPVENEFKDYDTRRRRVALTGAFEYQPDDANKLFLRGTWTRRTDDEFRNLLALVLTDGTLNAGSSDLVGSWRNTRYAKEFRHRIVRDTVFTTSAGGEHQLGDRTRLDYTVGYTRSEQDYPIRAQLLFRSNLRPTIAYDYAQNPNEPAFSIFETREHLNLGSYSFRQNTFREQDTILNEYAIGGNLLLTERSLFGARAEFQFGAKARIRDVFADNEQWRDRRGAAAPTLSLQQLLSNDPSTNFGYNLGNKFDRTLGTQYFATIRNTSQVDGTLRAENSIVSDYSANEDIIAGYGMTKLLFDKGSLILGFRVENTRFSGEAFRFDLVDEVAVPTSARRSYTNFFPNVTARFELAEGLVARGAITGGVARPNFRDVVPRVEENDETGGNFVAVSRGNPDLRATVSTNFDASLEYYFQQLGVVSAGVFYKDLKDYEFDIVRFGQFNGMNARIAEKDNADSGRIIGFELAAQGNFTFLPGFLKNFGAYANYTFSDAKITLPSDVPNRTGSVRLPNQSRHVYNMALFYEVKGFNARLAYTGRSDYVDEFFGDPRLDSFWEGRDQLDATFSVDVTKNINVYFEAKNLTNTLGVRYNGIRARTQEVEQFGRLFFLGARANF
ncbi:TonB-dependent receptor [Sandarakinorhabdus sp.]|uniref:TonB-dependent receptor n=1 Tax=Sandarakinorhabdus sp. TaxID=1916663 RepID=UPI003F711399